MIQEEVRATVVSALFASQINVPVFSERQQDGSRVCLDFSSFPDGMSVCAPLKTMPLLLAIAVSLAFAWILLPFYGAVLWGTVTAILFSPLHRRLLKSMGRWRNLAAFSTVMMIIAMVILPMTLIAASLTQEALAFYGRVQSGELDLVRFFQRTHDVLPAWAINLLDRFDLASLGAVQQKLSAALLAGSQYIATQALSIGQSTFDFIANLFVMLYLSPRPGCVIQAH